MPPKKKAATKRKAPTPSPKKSKAAKKAKTPATPASDVGSRPLIDQGEIGSRYAEPDGQSVGVDGIIALAEDLQIEVEDKVFLAICYEMGAVDQGKFTRSEVSPSRTLRPSRRLLAACHLRDRCWRG